MISKMMDLGAWTKFVQNVEAYGREMKLQVLSVPNENRAGETLLVLGTATIATYFRGLANVNQAYLVHVPAKKSLVPVHKATLLKAVRKRGEWSGYIAASNIAAHAVRDNQAMGTPIKIIYGNMYDRPHKYIVEFGGSRTPLEKYLNHFEYYNCNSETGKRVRFWEEEKT